MNPTNTSQSDPMPYCALQRLCNPILVLLSIRLVSCIHALSQRSSHCAAEFVRPHDPPADRRAQKTFFKSLILLWHPVTAVKNHFVPLVKFGHRPKVLLISPTQMRKKGPSLLSAQGLLSVTRVTPIGKAAILNLGAFILSMCSRHSTPKNSLGSGTVWGQCQIQRKHDAMCMIPKHS